MNDMIDFTVWCQIHNCKDVYVLLKPKGEDGKYITRIGTLFENGISMYNSFDKRMVELTLGDYQNTLVAISQQITRIRKESVSDGQGS